MKRAVLLAAALLLGCGGNDDPPASITSDTGVSDTSPNDSASTLGKVAVKVNFTGSRTGQLAVGAFTEETPKTRPPVTFDAAKSPSYPYATTLTDLEPGRYWIIAVIDLEPVSGVIPGPEDPRSTAMAVDVVAGETKSVEVTITEPAGDAGADVATD